MAPPCILIVDDYDALRVWLTEIFGGEGYTVLTAQNGREALQALERGPVDVLLTDLNMPVMDGWELARTLKKRPVRIPLVAMTADRNVAQLVGDLEAVAYLQKPFDVETVVSVIDKVVRAEPTTPPDP